MKVVAQVEVWLPNGEDDEHEWSHTSIKLEHNNEIFQAHLEIESTPIPREYLYAVYPGGLSIAPQPHADDCYLKKHNLALYNGPLKLSEDKAYPGQLLLQEAKLCDFLQQHPHPNIARYLGCVVEEGRVTGLCFTKYRHTLKYRVQNDPRPLDNEECLRGIEAGVRHLHSLGFIHNDLNPHNIMFLDDDTPVIIDFDSCWKENEGRGMKGSTYMWTDEKYDYKNSVRENDFSSLRRIREYLDDPDPFHLSM